MAQFWSGSPITDFMLVVLIFLIMPALILKLLYEVYNYCVFSRKRRRQISQNRFTQQQLSSVNQPLSLFPSNNAGQNSDNPDTVSNMLAGAGL